MLEGPQVRVVLRVRPPSKEELEKQQREGSEADESPWIRYDDQSVEVMVSTPPPLGDFRNPGTLYRKENPSNLKSYDASIDNGSGVSGNNGQQSHTTTALVQSHTYRSFTFDAILDDFTHQQEAYEYVGVPALSTVLNGCNFTLLAYGQTGSGKTHSMFGPAGGRLNSHVPHSPQYESRGLIPRLVEALFDSLTSLDPAERIWRVGASMFEIYMENIIDLFCAGPQATEYPIREDTLTKGVHVESLLQLRCVNAVEMLELVRGGLQRRYTAATESNDISSRSHCVLSLFLEQEVLTDGTVTVSRLNFVDLAGSEKPFIAQSEERRLREAQCINQSLAQLGNLIRRLTEPNPGSVPSRDSKLTHVLWDSLTGNGLTTLLCHASTAVMNRNETTATLCFAQRAKRIPNRPRVNRRPRHQEIGLVHASKIDRTRQSKQDIRSLNKLPKSGQYFSSTTSASDFIDVQRRVLQNLLSTIDTHKSEVRGLKKQLHSKEEELRHALDAAEFYKQKWTTLQRKQNEMCEEQKKREAQLIQACAAMERDRDALMYEVVEAQHALYRNNLNCRPKAPLVQEGIPITPQNSTNSENGHVGMRAINPMDSFTTSIIPEAIKPDSNNNATDPKTQGGLARCAQQRRRIVRVWGLQNPWKDIVMIANSKSIPRRLEMLSSLLSSVCLPRVLDVRIHQSLLTVTDALSTVNQQLPCYSPVEVLKSVETEWSSAIESGHPPEEICPSELLFYTFCTARDILLPYINYCMDSANSSSGNEEAGTTYCCDNNAMILPLLKVLGYIAGGQSVGSLSLFTHDDIVYSIDVVRNFFVGGVVEPKENSVCLLNFSDTFNDSVIVCDHTKAEVVAACEALSTALVHTVEAVGAGMLALLRERVHGGLTGRELRLACCIIQNQLSSVLHKAPPYPVLLHYKAFHAIELMENIVRVADSLRLHGEDNGRGRDDTTLDALCSESMIRALQMLRASMVNGNDANVNACTVFNTAEVREAAEVVMCASEAAQGLCLMNSEDMNGEDNSSGNKRGSDVLRNERRKWGEGKTREVLGDTESAVMAVRTYAVVLGDVNGNAGATASLCTPAVLSAVDLLLHLLYDTVVVHTTTSGGAPLLGRDNTPLLELLEDARTDVGRTLQGVSLMSPAGPQEEEEEGRGDVDAPLRDDATSPCLRSSTKFTLLNRLDHRIQGRLRSIENGKQCATVEIESMGTAEPKERTCRLELNVVNLTNPTRAVHACTSYEEGDVHTFDGAVSCSLAPSTLPRSIEALSPLVTSAREDGTRGNYIIDTIMAMMTPARPLGGKVSVMPNQVKGLMNIGYNCKNPHGLHDGVIQTEESAADVEAYRQFFLDVKATLGKEGEIDATAELLSIIKKMQDEWEFLQQSQGPALKKKLVQQEYKLKTLHGALLKLRSLVQEYPLPSSSSSSAVCNNRKLPQMLRQEVRDESLPLRRRRPSLDETLLRAEYRGASAPVSLPALELKYSKGTHTNTETAVDAEGIVEEVRSWFSAWHTFHTNVVQHDEESIRRVKRLGELLSTTHEERHAYCEKLNTLNAALLTKHEEIATLCKLLQISHNDVDALNMALSQEQNAATAAESAAAHMRLTTAQSELCEMAEMELQMRADELQALREEIPRLRALRNAGLALRKCDLLRRGLRYLLRRTQTITQLLHGSRFNTGTLETQRLSSLDKAAVLTAEIAEMRATLRQNVERRRGQVSRGSRSINSGTMVLDEEFALVASPWCVLNEHGNEC